MGLRLGWFLDEVLDIGGTDGRFGGGLGIVDYEFEGVELGPEDVEERDCFRGFGVWKGEESEESVEWVLRYWEEERE